MMKRALLVLLLSLAILTLSVGMAGAEEVLKVASEISYPPFEMPETDNTPSGFDMDLARALGEEMGVKVQLINVDWGGLIGGLQNGSFDMIMSAMTITEDRKKQINFSDPYFDTRQAILVRANDNSIKSKQDLVGKKIGVQMGTTGHFAVIEIDGVNEEKDIRPFPSSPEAIMELMNGGVNAAVIDTPVALYYKDEFTGFKIVGSPDEWDPEYYGIGIKKGREDLLERVNTALANLRENGKYQEIWDKYFGK